MRTGLLTISRYRSRAPAIRLIGRPPALDRPGGRHRPGRCLL